jgi:hypothetical protein
MRFQLVSNMKERSGTTTDESKKFDAVMQETFQCLERGTEKAREGVETEAGASTRIKVMRLCLMQEHLLVR